MTARYGLQGARSRELLTLGGRVLVHDNATELEYLIAGARIVAVPSDIPDEQTMPISAHPELGHISWPLRKADFR
ncbi:MAG: hypothetical protein ACREX8_01305 [Gammaproteobacteria bacterium]